MKLFCLVFLGIISACSNKPDICKKYLQKEYTDANLKHDKIFFEGKKSEAIAMVEEMLKKDPENHVAISYLGYYKLMQYNKNECPLEVSKEVYDLYKKSLEICETNRISIFNTIQILAEMQSTPYQNDAEIITLLWRYNSLYEKRSALLTIGGQAAFRLGRLDESLQYLNESLALDSTDALAYVFKGKYYSAKAEWRKALQLFNTSLALDSTSLGFHERGTANMKLGNTMEAINDFNTAISLSHDRWESYLGLGMIEVDRNNLDGACQFFYQAQRIEPSNITVNAWVDEYCPPK